jgi:hypothetical protein
MIAERGRMAGQQASGYDLRAKVEATIGRYKRVILPQSDRLGLRGGLASGVGRAAAGAGQPKQVKRAGGGVGARHMFAVKSNLDLTVWLRALHPFARTIARNLG